MHASARNSEQSVLLNGRAEQHRDSVPTKGAGGDGLCLTMRVTDAWSPSVSSTSLNNGRTRPCLYLQFSSDETTLTQLPTSFPTPIPTLHVVLPVLSIPTIPHLSYLAFPSPSGRPAVRAARGRSHFRHPCGIGLVYRPAPYRCVALAKTGS